MKGKELVMKLFDRPKLTMKLGRRTFKTKYAISLEKEAWYNRLHPSNKEHLLALALGCDTNPRRLMSNTIIRVARWLPMCQLPMLIRNAVMSWIISKPKGNSGYTLRRP